MGSLNLSICTLGFFYDVAQGVHHLQLSSTSRFTAQVSVANFCTSSLMISGHDPKGSIWSVEARSCFRVSLNSCIVAAVGALLFDSGWTAASRVRRRALSGRDVRRVC